MLTVSEAEQSRVKSNEFPIFLKTENNSRGQHILPTFSECSAVSKKKTLFYCSLIRVRAYSNLIIQMLFFVTLKKGIYTREGD